MSFVNQTEMEQKQILQLINNNNNCNDDDFESNSIEPKPKKQQTSICFKYSQNSDLKLALALSTSTIENGGKRKKEITNNSNILTGKEWIQLIEERASTVLLASFSSHSSNLSFTPFNCYYWQLTNGRRELPILNWKEIFQE